MKTIYYALLTIIGIILLYYLWPVFIAFVLIVVGFIWYLSYKSKKVFEDMQESADESPAYQQTSGRVEDVIDAEYREKEIE